MNCHDHLTDELMIRASDDELTPIQASYVEHHLSTCESCRRRSQAFRVVSGQIEAIVTETIVADDVASRDRLKRSLQIRDEKPPVKRSVRFRAVGSSIALAASLAVAVLIPLQRKDPALHVDPKRTAELAESGFEVNGEHFVALPYSNPDLPIEAPHIIQMQVPVSALADAGVVFEPVSDQMIAPDRAVLADILLGMDGQPLGIHILGSD